MTLGQPAQQARRDHEQARALAGRRPVAGQPARGREPAGVRGGQRRTSRSTTRSSTRAPRPTPRRSSRTSPGRRTRASRPASPRKAPIGGINWGVGAYTKHPQQAFEAAACMRNAENEKEAAIKGGLPPTLESLYSDQSLNKAYPFAALIKKQLANAARAPGHPGLRRRVAGHRQGGARRRARSKTNGFVDALRGHAQGGARTRGRCCERRRGKRAAGRRRRKAPAVTDRTQGRAQARPGCSARRP